MPANKARTVDKRHLTRPSPAKRARDTPVGTVGWGNDGGKWIVKHYDTAKGGEHRWVHYRGSREPSARFPKPSPAEQRLVNNTRRRRRASVKVLGEAAAGQRTAAQAQRDVARMANAEAAEVGAVRRSRKPRRPTTKAKARTKKRATTRKRTTKKPRRKA
jgi:hypothetical protein